MVSFANSVFEFYSRQKNFSCLGFPFWEICLSKNTVIFSVLWKKKILTSKRLWETYNFDVFFRNMFRLPLWFSPGDFAFCLFINYATCARGCKCIAQHIKQTFLWGTIRCPEKGKQNLQAKKVYSPYVNVYKKRTLILVQYPLVTRLKLIATKGSQTTARARV